MSKTFTEYLNRFVVGLNLVAGLATAIAVPVANLDLSSAAGVIAGLGAITLACGKFLSGWQAHEARVASADPGVGAWSTRLGKPEEAPHV